MDSKELADEVATHRRGRVPRALRRQQVLAEAHDLFVERGYGGASMDELARRVGVSKPVIYDIAGSKEQLFRDVIAVVDEELTLAVAVAVATEPDARRKLRAGILAFLNFVEGRREAWVSLLSSEGGPASVALGNLRRRQAENVAQLVAQGLPDAALRPDPLTAAALAQAINGAVEFVALWWRDHPEIPAESLADLLMGAFSTDLLTLSARSLAPGPG